MWNCVPVVCSHGRPISDLKVVFYSNMPEIEWWYCNAQVLSYVSVSKGCKKMTTFYSWSIQFLTCIHKREEKDKTNLNMEMMTGYGYTFLDSYFWEFVFENRTGNLFIRTTSTLKCLTEFTFSDFNKYPTVIYSQWIVTLSSVIWYNSEVYWRHHFRDMC